MNHTPFSDKKMQIALFITLVITIFFLVSLLGIIRLRPIMHFPKLYIGHWQKAAVPGDINGWMTFEYINFVFKLPPEYLKETFGLENVGYPWVTVRHVARVQKTDLVVFLGQIQDTVKRYQSLEQGK